MKVGSATAQSCRRRMSDSAAIGKVTAALQNLLQRQLSTLYPGTLVTLLAPNQVQESGTQKQVNLFLYRVETNPGLRNAEHPSLAQSPLALDIYYLLTIYGTGDNQNPWNHRLLGAAIYALHQTPILPAKDTG